MTLRVCFACVAVLDRGRWTSGRLAPEGRCKECGGPTSPPSKASLDALLALGVERAIDRWQTKGLLEPSVAATLRRSEGVGDEPRERASAAGARELDDVPSVGIFSRLTRSVRESADRWNRLVAEVETTTPSAVPERASDASRPDADAPHSDTSSRGRNAHVSGDATSAIEAGRGLFPGGKHADVGEGLEGLTSLDDTTDRGSSIALSQVALWFLGTLLVLAGSVLGVREAFRALAGPPRQVVVAGVFFAYHALFFGLSTLVSRKSVLAGRVLGGISVALLPIGFVALEALVQSSPRLGAGLALVALLGSWASLRALGARLAGEPDRALPYLLLPPLGIMLLVGFAPSDAVRVILPIVGLVSTAFAARRLALGSSFASRIGAFVVTLYAALALGIFAVMGAPGAAGVVLVPGSFAHGVIAFEGAVLATVVGEAFGGRAPRRDAPTFSRVLELTSYAALAVAGTLGARALVVGSPTDGGLSSTGLALASGPLAATVGFAAGSRRHGILFHAAAVFAFVAVFVLGARTGLSGGFLAAGSLGALLVAASRFAPARRAALEGWGATTGLGGVLLAAALAADESRSNTTTIVTAERVALVLAVAAHAAGGLGRARLHALGAMATFLALCTYWARRPEGLELGTAVLTALALAAFYGLVALAHGALLARRTTDLGERPFDDLSLGITALAALVATQLPGRAAASSLVIHADGLALREAFTDLAPRALPLALAGLALTLRALRDRSRLVAFLGALALGQAAIFALGASSGASCVMVSGMLAAVFSAFAAVRPAERTELTRGRLVLGSVPLAFGARRFDLLDGVSTAGLVFLARALYETVSFLGARSEPARERVLLGLAMAIGAMLLAFVSASHRALGLRGRVGTLAFAGLVVAMTAVANRVGRPLPPEIVGRNLSIVALGLWLVSRGLVRVGPKWGAWLGRSEDGAYYTYVPLAGTVAVGLLLAVDVGLVSGSSWTRALVVSPPTLVLGATLAALLVARTLEGSLVGRSIERVAALGLVLTSLGAAAQKGLLGPHLVPSGRLGTPWIVRGTELAVAAIPDGFVEPSALLPAGESLAGYVIRAQWGLFACAGALSALVLATRSARLATGLSRVILGRDEPSDVRGFAVTGVVASVTFSVLGACLVPSLESPATALTMSFGVVALFVLAFTHERRGDSAKALSALGVLLAGSQSAFVVVALGARGLPRVARSPDTLSSLDVGSALARFGPELALGLAVVATLAHLVPSLTGRTDEREDKEARLADVRFGLVVGRDVLLVVVLLVLSFVASVGSRVDAARSSGFVALGLVLAVSSHAMVRDRTARHAYLVQVGFVAGYAFVRLAMPEVSPFVDAVAALVYGFLLVGATALARKLELAPVAVATRRFATALPVLVVLLRPTDGGLDSAALAAGASVLYATLAVFDKSRILGALAAFAANVALLFVALSAGFDGPEAYLGPLGLFLALVVQLFTPKLDLPTRRALRIVASLLVYAPVAARLASRLGSSSDGTTSVLFGALCFVGIVIGMVLHVRAYVVLGTLFVTFDVLANLVFAGLRDHRVGFVLLSVSGLGILGVMIGTTLAREKALAMYARVKGAMRGWE